MKKRPSQRGWEILFQYVKGMSGRSGQDGDLADDERADAQAAAAESARRLLKDPAYQRLRLEGLQEVVEDFVMWLQLDPAGPHYERELSGIHSRASSRYWALFRPEEIIYEAKQVKNKKEKEASDARSV
jgi:hypothetical protein